MNPSGYFCEGFSQISREGEEEEKFNESLREKNLNYLKAKYGVFTTADGLKIAYVTGDAQFIKDHHSEIMARFTDEAKNGTIDILLSSPWPQTLADEERLFYGNSQIDPIVEVLKPRYHFCVGSSKGKFHERSPFNWGTDDQVTRFISLGKFGNEAKEKWIYAFNLNKELNQEPPKNLTANPFDVARESKKIQQEQVNNKRKSEEDPTTESTGKQQLIKKPRKQVLPENCFFCLSNPKLQTHMIISIGDSAYLTIAKGPLTKPTSQMPFSGHCLIIPIGHLPNLPSSEQDKAVVATPLYNEILRYKSSLIKMFAKFDQAVMFYQINKKENVHFHIQCVPIAVDFLQDFEKVLKKNVEINNKSKFRSNSKFDFKRFTNAEDEEYLKIINDSESEYVTFTIFNKSISQCEIYLSVLEKDSSLDLQFGRKVMAFLLQTPNRVKWVNCEQSVNREEEETELFKEGFKEFDFTLEE